MTRYNKVNNITGWLVFLMATSVYFLTVEPTCSFWDNGEFVPSGYKLQLSHSPGAPLFAMLGHIFMLFAASPSGAALMFNHMSNIMGGLMSLFLFWSITALGLKALNKKPSEISTGELIALMGAGIVGAMAACFCDSIWFSMVEAIVFASSAAFTAFVFWAILKWERVADTPKGDRWILFIAYIMGLSIGVHLLNLLTIPAIVFIYYFKKFPYSRWGMFKTLVVGCIILGSVQYGIIQSLPYLAANADILFVNSFGLPFNSGSIFFALMLVTTLTTGILFSLKGTPSYYFVFVISFLLALIGANLVLALALIAIFLVTFTVTKNYILTFYMTIFAMLLGFLVNPFMLVVGLGVGYVLWYFVDRERNPDAWNNQPNDTLNKVLMVMIFIIMGYSSYTMVLIRANANPSINMSDPKDLTSLLSYLSREQYGDHPFLYGQAFTARPYDVDFQTGEMKYWKGPKRYEELERKPIIKYNDEDKMFFPRAWDYDDPAHVRFYQDWLHLKPGEKPSEAKSLEFFFSYQINYMYIRYFLWNFVGRQNDIQGSRAYPQDGNWISGINFIDNIRLGPQDNLPPSMADNKGRNKFYFLPLILGLIGMFYQFRVKKQDAFVVLLLIFFMGIAIVIFLNQYPLQPRERDYSYEGSFYAFTIWIGLGVLGVYNWMREKMKPVSAALLAFVLCLSVPAIMGAQGWDDHDRSNRYTCRDFGKDYLESCAPNAILFTQGDNDTYPLWYAQEVENIRPDVRVVNLSLLGVDWYIDNLKRKVNESDILPISIPSAAYRGTKRDALRFPGYRNVAQRLRIDTSQYFNLKDVVSLMVSDDPKYKVQYSGGTDENFLPTRRVYVDVDKKAVIANGTVQPEDTASIVPRLAWTLNRTTILKPSLILLDILQQNEWKRPIYFAISVSSEEYMGLNDYLQQEGLTYRLVPVKRRSEGDGLPGAVQPRIMYDNVMNKFAWGGVDSKTHNVYLDENILRMVTNLRSNFARLANAIVKTGDTAKAVKVLDKCMEVLPERNVPYSLLMLPIAQAYYHAGALDKGKAICAKLLDLYSQNMQYYASLDDKYRSYYRRDVNEAVYLFNEIMRLEVTDMVDKLKKESKASAAAYNISPEIINTALDAMKQAAIADYDDRDRSALSIAMIVQRGASLIKMNYKDGFDEKKFSDEYEKKLSADAQFVKAKSLFDKYRALYTSDQQQGGGDDDE